MHIGYGLSAERAVVTMTEERNDTIDLKHDSKRTRWEFQGHVFVRCALQHSPAFVQRCFFAKVAQFGVAAREVEMNRAMYIVR